VSSLCRFCNPEETCLKILIKISVDVNLVDNLFRGQGASLMFNGGFSEVVILRTFKVCICLFGAVYST
jgi:hypothetical protein